MDETGLLALATELAHRASEAIIAVRARGFEVRAKSDKSPVTEADHAAESIIAEGLRRATPEIPVIAEEEIAAGRLVTVGCEFWLVDPLDGTREFAAGRDEFTVNIGLVRDRRPVLGVVAVPAYRELFMAIPGRGAWKRTREGDTPISARKPPPSGMAVLASRHYAKDPQLPIFLQGKRVASVRHIGSAVKFCRLAEGEADLYPRFGRTMEWDTAGPQAVLEAAGGHLFLLTGGGPLSYGKPGWENPAFVCTGRAPL